MSPFNFLFKKKKVEKGLLGRRQGEQGVLEDGARLLQELISFSDGKAYYPIHMFSVEEIEEAIAETNSRISPNKETEEAEETCETGIFASNYKGIYQGRQIFIKAYRGEREYAFNEIATITQINHANVIEKDEIIQLLLDNGLSMDPRQVGQSVACAGLVSGCIAHELDQRPPMKEVAEQLQLIQRYELPSSSL
ncbi:hypothetical protein MRB53_001746 [Persea americana]|uniref:Uncharacterized protein n=1 Tax=Persea americana TaxID=3435 RepID=A0ACC2MT83_PERAE|nr:hypothetical protein MRB53_001746 [Persea americana]